MIKTIDVTSMGELITDFSFCGLCPTSGYPLYIQNPGGGPANVCVAITRLKGTAAFIGKIGCDKLSDTLFDTMKNEHVLLDNLLRSTEKSFVAFVTTDEVGDRSFTFYADKPADLELKPKEINEQIIATSKILNFGGRSLSFLRILPATDMAIEYAKKNSTAVAFDANIRLNLWESNQMAKDRIVSYMPQFDYIKLSEEELEFLGFSSNPTKMLSKSNKILFVTHGEEGAEVYTNDYHVRVPAFSVECIDTTGAGDAFWGGMLKYLSSSKQTIPDKHEMEHFLRLCNGGAAISVTKKGGIPSLPTSEQIEKFLKDINYRKRVD